jgi:hypothetical protein
MSAMVEVIPTAMAASTALNLVLAQAAHWRGRRRAAHGLNGVALGITFAGSLVALAKSGAANANAGGLALLALLAGLTTLCFYNSRKPAMSEVVFWLAWSVNLTIVAALLYLLLWFKVF